jgi:REP element-mobilizing transposase RayT
LPSIIRGFKAASKNKINSKFDNNFQWQPRYYEHIIRNEQDYARIKDYIANNPINWQNDKNNPQNFKHDQEI